jgi:UDP-glucose 4-epimerase
MHYLITGGDGFIGRSLTHRLVLAGHEVRIFDNSWRKPTTLAATINDVLNPSAINAACNGIDCCIHLAAINGTENFYKFPELTLRVGVLGTFNVLDACRAQGVKTVVLASSSEVYHEAQVVPTPETEPIRIPDIANPRFSYSGSKIMTELLGQHFTGIDRIVTIRPHNIYGPDMGRKHVIPQIIERALSETEGDVLTIQGDGYQTRGYCHVDDFIDGLLLLVEKGEHRGIYNIGNDVITTSQQIAERILRIMGSPKTVVVGDDIPSGSPRWRCPDISKLRALGYDPKISLAAGLPAVVKWYRENRA